MEVEDGQAVAKRGDHCDVIWFVASGSLRCEVDGIEVQQLGAGQCIGEMSFVQVSLMVSSGTPLTEAWAAALRTADVIASEHTELLELSFDDAWAVVKKVPNLFYTLKEVADMRTGNCGRKLKRAGSPASTRLGSRSPEAAVRAASPVREHGAAHSGSRKQPAAELPDEEVARIRAVRMLGNLDIPPLQALGDEVRVYFAIQQVSINLVDKDEVRQYRHSSSGMTGLLATVKRSCSLCSDAIANPEARTETCGVLVVEDVAKSEQFRDRTAVRTGFYAASPIRYAATDSSPGQVVGTLCLYDEAPREGFGAEECRKLREYSDKVTAILAAPLPSWLGGNAAEQSRLQSIEERVSVLAVSAQMVCVGAARGRACAVCDGFTADVVTDCCGWWCVGVCASGWWDAGVHGVQDADGGQGADDADRGEDAGCGGGGRAGCGQEGGPL